MSMTGRRRDGWLPLCVCLLVILTCFAAVGATCAACISDHPGQAIERTLISVPVAVAPPAAVWSLMFVLAFAPLVLRRPRFLAHGRASPAALQRFLF